MELAVDSLVSHVTLSLPLVLFFINLITTEISLTRRGAKKMVPFAAYISASFDHICVFSTPE